MKKEIEMSRWTIEKSGTGIEKSGTGIEKSGTGIEKSGTGIEKSGTGIEKSGTGIRRSLLACSLATIAFASGVHAEALSPNGELTITVENGRLTASWVLGGSVFVGFGSVNGNSSSLSLLEIASLPSAQDLQIAGGGTGSQIAGGGTGDKAKIAGGGTGSHIAGGGTGSQIAGGGTGSHIAGGGTGSQIAGGGTGSQIAGGGTGSHIAGGGTGDTILIAGGGTGSESISITLPSGTQMGMEITLSCNSATVYVMDSAGYEVVSFPNVKVKGDSGQCGDSGTQFPGLTPRDDNNFDGGDSRDFYRQQ